jgi:hypothetical protein
MDHDIDIDHAPKREPERDKAQPGSASERQSNERSRERETVDLRGYRYQVSPSDLATVREIGCFRTIAVSDLAKYQYRGQKDIMREDLRSLVDQGLIRQRMVWTGGKHDKLSLVVLTKTGRELLERNAQMKDGQAIYAGFVKPAEVAHDAAIYRMFQAEKSKIEGAGGRVRRVVLDYELKRNVYRPLAKAKASLSSTEYARRQDEVARQNGLKVTGGKILLPDLRIEYETTGGAAASVDLEYATDHYRAAPLRGKAQAGFKFYAPESARSLGQAFDPEIVADILYF